MLRNNPLKQAFADGKPVFGLLNSIPSPLVVEMIGYADKAHLRVVATRERYCPERHFSMQ